MPLPYRKDLVAKCGEAAIRWREHVLGSPGYRPCRQCKRAWALFMSGWQPEADGVMRLKTKCRIGLALFAKWGSEMPSARKGETRQ
jgi:hypothetical protein